MAKCHLSPTEDVAPVFLPQDRTPLWIERTVEESDLLILTVLKNEYIESESVTVMYEKDRFNKEAKAWCEEEGWQYINENLMYGAEDECVVLMANFTPELMSRGRKFLVVVTTRGDW